MTEGGRLRGARRRRGREFPDTDPMGTYARRSSILQPSRQGSTYNSPLPGSYIPMFIESLSIAGAGGGDKLGSGQTASNMVPFQTQGYVVPTRSWTGLTAGGEMTRELLWVMRMQRRVGRWGVDARGRMDVGAICSGDAVLLAKYAPLREQILGLCREHEQQSGGSWRRVWWKLAARCVRRPHCAMGEQQHCRRRQTLGMSYEIY
ncbi:hypothetical protein BJ912DRAFT_987882 [Pholiota molesta]|nr:hypothetical protein BJ912DRAFT_987882 [Pholiota molesta]